MIIDYILFSIGLIYLIIASIQDLKTREVSDWIPFSLITIVLIIKLVTCIYLQFALSPNYFLTSLFSLTFFIVLGYLLYYFDIFGGGDAKLLMAIGVLIPSLTVKEAFLNDLIFISLLFLCGSIWNFIASLKWKDLKEGRPFVPAFLLAFILFIFFRNWIVAFIS